MSTAGSEEVATRWAVSPLLCCPGEVMKDAGPQSQDSEFGVTDVESLESQRNLGS